MNIHDIRFDSYMEVFKFTITTSRTFSNRSRHEIDHDEILLIVPFFLLHSNNTGYIRTDKDIFEILEKYSRIYLKTAKN